MFAISSILPTRSEPLFDEFLEVAKDHPTIAFYRFYLFFWWGVAILALIPKGKGALRIRPAPLITSSTSSSSPSPLKFIQSQFGSLVPLRNFPILPKAVRMATYSRLRLLSAFRAPLLTRCYATESRLASDHVRVVEVGPRDGLQNEK